MQTKYHFMVSILRGDLTDADDFNADVYCLTSWWLLSERNLILKAARNLMEAVVLTVISVFLESESLLKVIHWRLHDWCLNKTWLSRLPATWWRRSSWLWRQATLPAGCSTTTSSRFILILHFNQGQTSSSELKAQPEHFQAKSPDPTCPPSPVVVWKMRTPEKQPLVRREPPEEVRSFEISWRWRC